MKIKIPTSSKLDALSKCAGKHNAELNAPDEPPSAIAQAGTDMHSALAGEEPENQLTRDQTDTVGILELRRKELAADVFGDDPFNEVKELDLVMNPFSEGKFSKTVFKGRMDYLAQTGATHTSPPTRALVVDYKTGYVEVISSESIQLRSYALLVSENTGCKNIVAAVIQPNHRVVPVEYSETDLAAAKDELESILLSALDEKAKRTAHPDACRYCKAKATCPEACATTEEIATVKPMEVTARELPRLLEACAIAEGNIDVIRKMAREILADDPSRIDGWRLKKGRTSRVISDHAELRQRIIDSGTLSEEQMRNVGKLSLSEVERMIRDELDCTASVARDKLYLAASDTITIKENQPTLARG